jgi:hypothetical protein
MGEESDPIPVLLARIEVKLDNALSQTQDHETRIRSLEKWRYTLPVTVLVSVASAVSTTLNWLIQR